MHIIVLLGAVILISSCHNKESVALSDNNQAPASGITVPEEEAVVEESGQLDFDESVDLDSKGCPLNSWWSDTYAYRQPLSIRNVDQLASRDQTIRIELNHSALVAQNKSRADGNDMRLIYVEDDCSLSELNIVKDPESSWNSNDLALWTKLSKDIDTNASDSSYYLYYGNPLAQNPRYNPEDIFMVFEDFEQNQLNDANRFNLNQNGDRLSVEDSALVISGSTDTDNQFTAFGMGLVRSVPVNTVMNASISVVNRGSAGWKAAIGLAGTLFLIDDAKARYYDPTPPANFVDLSNEIFTEQTYSNYPVQFKITPDQIAFTGAGDVLIERSIAVNDFSPYFSFSPDAVVQNFEYRVHYVYVRPIADTIPDLTIELGEELQRL